MKNELYLELTKHLSQLVMTYRQLLDIVRKEKQILLNVDLPALAENNKIKEDTLTQIKTLESDWMAAGHQLYILFGIETEETPRLAEIARYYTGNEQSKLLQVQSVLSLLVERTSKVNKENEELIRSALNHIRGAMQSIRDTLSKNSTYEKKGKKSKASTESSGRLVSKEV